MEPDKLVLGKDYYIVFIANPKLYELACWKIPGEPSGELKDKSTDKIKYYYSKYYPEGEYHAYDELYFKEKSEYISPYMLYLNLKSLELDKGE